MITKINMENIASYKEQTSLVTDKRVNLIYGLNGTGKSTLSEFLYNRTKECYNKCSIEGLDNEELLVYNQQFVRDYFYTPDGLKGVFTLSKENKAAEEKIKAATKTILQLEKEKNEVLATKINYEKNMQTLKQTAESATWGIKTKYTGGDRVLAFCLEGLMGSKESLLNHLLSLKKIDSQPTYTIDEVKKESEIVHDSSIKSLVLLPKITSNFSNIESHELFEKEIIGNENSTVAELITKLGNSDWVKQGLEFIQKDIPESGDQCPFCQENTVTDTLVERIKSYFDKTYEDALNELKKLSNEYESEISKMPSIDKYESNHFILEKKMDFDKLYTSIHNILNNNVLKIADKSKTPSQKARLSLSLNAISMFNEFIDKINEEILEHNKKIENRSATINSLKLKFWSYMRWEYDQTISQYLLNKADLDKKILEENKKFNEYSSKISVEKDLIIREQKNTVNIEDAINNINRGLVEIGIEGFTISKHKENLYKINRKEPCPNTFETLSEGEKMIISFLYFRELCKGLKAADSQLKNKIVVIDDPISSLSHVYVFNIGQMIKNDFINSKNYEQVFILTHSLYFFYEMTDPNHERRYKNQKLYRLIKNSNGSKFSVMSYEEIQNDYHSYWSVVKDEQQPPALIANCMRNIIEYFFNFIEKKDLNNVFQKQSLQAIKFQAFNRYVNRESHSLGQNIFDYKEFNYNVFKEALQLVFEENGYGEHYKIMMK